MRHGEDSRQQEACLDEEEVIEDFLSYWTSPNDVRACVFEFEKCEVMTNSTEEEEPKVLEARMEIEDSMYRPVQEEVLEGATKTEESCDLKTKKLCVFAGTLLEDGQDSEVFDDKKTLNLKSVQTNAEIVKS